jgi:hypothetical protein
MKWYFKKGLFLSFYFMVFFFACSKEEQKPLAPDVEFEFGVLGQLFPVIKNKNQRSLEIIIPQEDSKSNLKAFYTLPPKTQLWLNNSLLVDSQTTLNYSMPVRLSLISENHIQQDWTVYVKTELEAYGLGAILTASKSLDRNYEFYREQKGSGLYAIENCGPAVAAMAVHWADSELNKTVLDARKSIKPQGGDWSTSDLIDYLTAAGIQSSMVYLSNVNQNVKKYIDLNYLLILCLDMHQIKYNANPIEKTNKFYQTFHSGWSHFLLVKGYRIVDGTFYLEVYDPNSYGKIHDLSHQPKGKDRYYAADQIKLATDAWWKYAIVVAPKGESVKLY